MNPNSVPWDLPPLSPTPSLPPPHTQVRAELAPWEKRIGEVNSRVGVATAERDALAKRAEDARRRLDGALKGLAAAQQSAAAKSKQIQELEAAAARCRCVCVCVCVCWGWGARASRSAAVQCRLCMGEGGRGVHLKGGAEGMQVKDLEAASKLPRSCWIQAWGC